MFGIAITAHSVLTLFLIVAAGLLLLLLFLERRRKQTEIEEGIAEGLGKAEHAGHITGYKQAAREYDARLSRPGSPTNLPRGKYKVEYVLHNGPVPLSALVSQDTIIYAEGKEKGRTKEAWFVQLPYNRRLTQPVPFTLVVDEAGIGYEPWQEPVVPPTEPPKAAEAAA